MCRERERERRWCIESTSSRRANSKPFMIMFVRFELLCFLRKLSSSVPLRNQLTINSWVNTYISSLSSFTLSLFLLSPPPYSSLSLPNISAISHSANDLRKFSVFREETFSSSEPRQWANISVREAAVSEWRLLGERRKMLFWVLFFPLLLRAGPWSSTHDRLLRIFEGHKHVKKYSESSLWTLFSRSVM